MAALVGGWDGKHELASAKLLVFDDSRKGMQWLQIPELPAPIVNPAVCADSHGRLVVAGAYASRQCVPRRWQLLPLLVGCAVPVALTS